MHKTIRDFIGIPFKSRGCSYKGVDCYGLCVLFNKEVLEVELPDYRDLYIEADDIDQTVQAIKKGRDGWQSVDFESAKIGDVALFRQMGDVSHCGVFIDDTTFLHIRIGQLSSLQSFDSMNWLGRLEGVMTWK